MQEQLEPNIEKDLKTLKNQIHDIEELNYNFDIEKLKETIEEINHKENKLNLLIEKRNELQELKNQLRHVEKKSEAYNTSAYENILKVRYQSMNSEKLKSKINQLAKILIELDEKEKMSLWNLILSIVVLRKRPEDLKQNGILMHLMMEEYYIKSLIEENERLLESENFEKLKEETSGLYKNQYIPISKTILKQVIKKQIDSKVISEILEKIETLKKVQPTKDNPTPVLSGIKEDLLHLYPVVLTTVDSVISNY